MTTETSVRETSDARDAFIRLREAAGLPTGGEIVLKEEVVELAEKLDVEAGEKTKPRIVFDILSRYVYLYHTRSERMGRTWEDAQEGCRGYDYIQSREADKLADVLEAMKSPVTTR